MSRSAAAASAPPRSQQGGDIGVLVDADLPRAGAADGKRQLSSQPFDDGAGYESRQQRAAVGAEVADDAHQCAIALPISSVIFLASPSTITVLSR